MTTPCAFHLPHQNQTEVTCCSMRKPQTQVTQTSTETQRGLCVWVNGTWWADELRLTRAQTGSFKIIHQSALICTWEKIKCKTPGWPLNTCSWTLHPLLWCANPPEALCMSQGRWTAGEWGWQHQHSCPAESWAGAGSLQSTHDLSSAVLGSTQPLCAVLTTCSPL